LTQKQKEEGSGTFSKLNDLLKQNRRKKLESIESSTKTKDGNKRDKILHNSPKLFSKLLWPQLPLFNFLKSHRVIKTFRSLLF